MLDVITIGDIKLDTFVLLNDANLQCQLKMPECQLCMEYGGKILVSDVESQMAGSAPNVAIGLSRMGLKTAIISQMGNDGTYELALKKLKEEKVSTTSITTKKGIKSAYSVVLNFKEERTILTSHVQSLYRLPKNLPPSKWLYLSEMGSGYEGLFSSVIHHKKKHKTKIAFNPGSLQIQEKKPELFELLRASDIVFVNVEEAQRLTGEKEREIHHLAKSLWELAQTELVLTDGKNGAYYFDGSLLLSIPIFPGKRIETTGAGDAFATGFLSGILLQKPPEEALRWAAINAASVIEYVGPQKGLLTIRQMKTRLQKHPEFKTHK